MRADRVFVHALNTVKKIPKTGASRPPPSDRLRLYGLYKQAMEGDVDGVMERPAAGAGLSGDELQREKDKWDAWNAQSGLGKTEAKRRYIEALIETMHRYATTPDAKELVAELEFVWNQIKNNSPSASSSKGSDQFVGRRFTQPASGTEGPLKVLSPMSEDDAAERESRRQAIEEEDDEEEEDTPKKGTKWSRSVENALVKMSAEVAALREQITTGREWRFKKERSFPAWLGWVIWMVMKHLAIDMVLLAFILLWMRKRKDRRLEDLKMASPRKVDYAMAPSSPRSPEFMGIDSGPAQPMEEDPIPPLESVSAAIFVPLEESILKQAANPPKTEAERLRFIIQRLDHHAEDVKANMMFLFRREQARVIQAARIHEATHGVQNPPPLDRSHVNAMLSNMNMPKVPGRDYTAHHPLPPVAVQQWQQTPREQMVGQLLTTAENAILNLDGFDGMMAKMKEKYKKALEVEEEKERVEEKRKTGEEARKRRGSA
ncbi:hypothetical protein ACHAQA_007392 [Verticillium albo-atrum]